MLRSLTRLSTPPCPPRLICTPSPMSTMRSTASAATASTAPATSMSATALPSSEEPIERLKLITCHLGNGSSIAAVDQGKVIDTSMGMTPLAGLMMGTRCGDLDPSVVNYLKYNLEITGHELDEILNKSPACWVFPRVSSDKRDVEEAAMNGNKRAQLASDMLNYQIKRPSAATLPLWAAWTPSSLPAASVSMTPTPRAKICHHMDWLGIRIDTDKTAMHTSRRKMSLRSLPGAPVSTP